MTTVLMEEIAAKAMAKSLPKGGLTWFEIATNDIQRAKRFYETVMGDALIDVSHDEPMFMFPPFGGEVTGAIVKRDGQVPCAGGTLAYLRLAGSLADAMERVAAAGGSIVTGATTAPKVAGVFCVIADSEGNHVGLHARK